MFVTKYKGRIQISGHIGTQFEKKYYNKMLILLLENEREQFKSTQGRNCKLC